jgi:hypothetical protein
MDEAMAKELLELERRYWQALRDHDEATALSLSDDPCIVTGAQGVASLDRATMAGMLKQPGWKLNRYEIEPDVKVKKLSDDIAVLAYKVHEVLTIDGERLELDAAESSTWVRRNGQWVCALHTESLAGDPYGRDRHPAA